MPSQGGTSSRDLLYEGLALMADPIHGYVTFTAPAGEAEEMTEKDLIDSPWVQRLRYINQLQSARWVYPSAEHSRFVHSLGAMHVAGRFARHLYPSLKEIAPDCPSVNFIEGLLRTAVLLHDVGHGPFCHFFDDNFLDEYDLTHEKLGQAIITQAMGKILSAIRRSPGGPFAPGEQLDPVQIAFLIGKDTSEEAPRGTPSWLLSLKPLFSGVYTADNLDYVLRDSYMCGVAIGPVDLNRLIHYTFLSEKGLTLHRAGLSALKMFLSARLYLYSNVYYHRTTRAIDLHLREIFRETIRVIFPANPLEKLDAYLDLNDWSLIQEVKGWVGSRARRRAVLGMEWKKILDRDVKWKMAYETILSVGRIEKGRSLVDPAVIEREIRNRLPIEISDLAFRVDMASQDPRPINPLMMGNRQIYLYNPSTREISKEALAEHFESLPAKVVVFRIFALNHQQDQLLSRIADQVLGSEPPSIKTNV
jgi:HD superfamily phosphohydrolase